MNRKTYYIAVGGLASALSMVILFLTGIVPASEIALPAIAGILLIPVVIEAGPRWALLIFVSVSLLAFFFCPNKSAALFYIVFFGHYPIVKRYIEMLPTKLLRWVLKYAVFDVCVGAALAFTFWLGGLPKEFNSTAYIVFSIVIFNITFLIYDFALTRMIVFYFYKIRKKFKF